MFVFFGLESWEECSHTTKANRLLTCIMGLVPLCIAVLVIYT